MCVNELDKYYYVWEVKVMSNSKIWTLTNQLLHLFATLHVCWFFLFIYAFKPIKVYINMHRTV